MELKDRIGAILECSQMNISEFSRFVGFKTPQAVRELIKGNTKNLSESACSKILAAYPQLNSKWLLTGEGEMLNTADSQTGEDAGSLSAVDSNSVPLIPASAFAGGVKGFAPEGIELSRCERIVSPMDGAEMAIPITGKSMEPDYPDGSIAFIRKINESSFIPWGHTVILDTENGAFIKNIYPDENDDSYIWARSINTAYPPLHIPKSSIFRIFRVLGTTRIFTTM